MEEKYAIIVAGGEGTRMGGTLPKQFQKLCGRPVAWWSLKAFHEEDPSTRLVLVVNPKCLDLWEELFEELREEERFDHVVIAGGISRTDSVIKGLNAVEHHERALVAIHDAARPLIDKATIARGWKAAAEHGGAVPVVPLIDSIRQLDCGGSSHAVDRSRFVAVQTPQVFKASELIEAYKSNSGAAFTDDASAYELLGKMPALYEGLPANFKVTTPGDIERAELLLCERQNKS